MKILLGEFNVKLGREDIFKPTIGNEGLHHDRNYNGVGIEKFSTLKNLAVKSTIFLHRNIHKYTWTSPDGKTRNQIDHISTGRRWHSSVLDVRSFRGADCDSNHYLVVAKFREILAVSKQAAHKSDVDRFNLRKINELELRKQFQIDIMNRFAVFQELK